MLNTFYRNELVENESCEDFVWDIVNEVADNACNIIFEDIITDRVAPYAVFSAKELLFDLIEVGQCYYIFVVLWFNMNMYVLWWYDIISVIYCG